MMIALLGGTYATLLLLLLAIYRLQDQLTELKEKMMAQFDDVTALVTGIKDATDKEAAELQTVSDRIDKLVAGLPTGGLSAAEVEQLKVQLSGVSAAQQPIIDRLTVLGTDPANPIPPPTPTP